MSFDIGSIEETFPGKVEGTTATIEMSLRDEMTCMADLPDLIRGRLRVRFGRRRTLLWMRPGADAVVVVRTGERLRVTSRGSQPSPD